MVKLEGGAFSFACEDHSITSWNESEEGKETSRLRMLYKVYQLCKESYQVTLLLVFDIYLFLVLEDRNSQRVQ